MQRPLLLNGFMASGKSTLGRLVAQRAGRTFIDLDERIESRAGMPVPEIFARQGERAFRQWEAEALEEVLSSGRPDVVALGGGALLARSRRLKALEHALVVTLAADVEEISRRVAAQPEQRPLLQGGSAVEQIEQLLEQRGPAYAECHARLDTTARSPEELAGRLLELWQRDGVAVAAGEHSYMVEIGADIAVRRLPEWAQGRTRILLITDRHVAPLHAARVREALGGSSVELIELPAGEVYKTLGTVESIWQRASAIGADRSSLFVGLGGGVVTDIAGFAAASWMRGVPWIAIPTTLLAMVDASVGGKTAVDLGKAKNCVGAFWQPSAVFCDVSYSATEPPRGASALSEVVKTALIGDPGLLELLERESAAVLRREPGAIADIVRRSVRVKARVVGQDAREQGIRAALNLGHTFGHALEAAAGFDRLSHGEAISLGLVAALRLGQRLAVTPAPLVARVTRLLARLGLPTDLSSEPLDKAAELLGLDKKRKGRRVKFVLVREPGQIEFRNLELGELARLAGDLSRSD
ncbi:MAG TPA: 3-dehydroquinate synthase [Polyangiaceae bacterium]|jgi:shikimate kinase/3-dehydroquinate synthase|nr:3-dehydroquinate synthase [Polyangiaceae bacterium]